MDIGGYCEVIVFFRNKTQARAVRPVTHEREGLTLFRVLLLMGVLGGVCWAFWINSERFAYKLGAQGRLEDEIQAFSKEQRAEIVQVIVNIEKKFSVKLWMRASKELFSSVDTPDDGILLGICPTGRQTVLLVPPLWRSPALSGLAAQTQDYVAPGFDNGQWPELALKSLYLLEAGFNSLLPAR